MIQTEHTAIVLRHVNYRDNDRMVTLLSPSRGRIDAVIRNCRKPKSHNLNSGELFALGDFMLHENNNRTIVTSVRLIETFYPLRSDYDRLTCGIYLLNLAEAAAEPEQEQQELFLLLLHTLSRLCFSDQPWKPLLAGFLLHFSTVFMRSALMAWSRYRSKYPAPVRSSCSSKLAGASPGSLTRKREACAAKPAAPAGISCLSPRIRFAGCVIRSR